MAVHLPPRTRGASGRGRPRRPRLPRWPWLALPLILAVAVGAAVLPGATVHITPATVPGLAATARLVADLRLDGRAGLVVRPGGVSDADAGRVTGLPVVAALAHQRGLAASVDRGLGMLTGRGPLARTARDLLADPA